MSKMRFTWAAALLVLCVGVLAGGALAQTNWTPGTDNIPASLGWGQSLDASIATTNTGTTTWGTNTSIISVDTPTSAAIASVNRWGATNVPIAGPVEHADDFTGLYTWEFGISAPPIAAIEYATPVGPTTPPTAAALACTWALAQDGSPVGGPYTTLPLAGNDVFMFAFPDLTVDDPGTPANEAQPNGYVAELAGRVPMIVGGYANGTYRPTLNVTRGNMAVFMKRACGLLDTTYVDGTFDDVDNTYPAAGDIQACVDAGIVQGYAVDNTYRPANPVTRGSMAIYIARGLAGGDEFVPTPTGTATFPDVPSTAQPWKYVEYAVANDVVQGYGDGTYRPTSNVTRGSMAVFVYRAFVQSTPSVVALAGPAVTDVDIDTANYIGWSSIDSGLPADPGPAYVGLDVLRLGDADVTVDFALMDGVTVIASGSDTISDIATKKAAAAASGVPYVYAKWDIPAGLAEGTYTLVASVGGAEFAHQPEFTIGDPVPPVEPTVAVWAPATASKNGGGTTTGDATALLTDDDTYYSITNGTDGTTGFNATGPLPTGVVATSATVSNVKKIRIEMVFNTSLANPTDIGFSLMQSGSSGGKRYLVSPDETTTTDATFVYETACEDRIADALWTDRPNYRVLSCGTFCGTQPYASPTYTFNVDMVKAYMTLK